MSLMQVIAGHHGPIRSMSRWAVVPTDTLLSPAAFRDSTVFPNIGQDAKRLKVSRHHLWSVLTGRRQSASLLARYQALKSKKEAA